MQTYLEKIFINRLKELNFCNDNVKILFEKPKLAQFGDVSTNIAMLLTKKMKKNPLDIANTIVEPFANGYEFIQKVEVAKPGFINITLKNEFYINKLNEVASKPNYGKSDIASGKTVLVEFVSANPTGLLHLGHGRQAAIGDTISNLLEYIGYKVTREYYFNNAGRQMRKLAESVYAIYMENFKKDFEFPEDGYHGNYIKEIASKIYEQDYDKYINVGNLDYFKEYAEKFLFAEIKKTIEKMGVNFDSFYNEDSLYKNGKIDDVVNILKSKGLAFEREGALWFAADKIDESLDEKVIIKSTGEPTYRLPDIAYHREKILRGYDLIIDIFGADHIATYPDVIAGLKALDMDYSKIKVLIHQFVTLIKDGKPYKMSKRNADVVTLDDLIDEVGCDAVRYFFVMRSMGTHLEFDIGLAKEQSDKNPVYYLQYAHARIASILRFAMSESIEISKKVDFSLIKENAEINLIKQILDFPYIIESSALTLEPHRLTNYLFDLANDFHKFYHDHRVVTEDKELTAARMMLCQVTKNVFVSGFNVLGISSPEKM
jgi:arginyl-tRNA synthetase